MRRETINYLLFLALTSYLFIGCTTQEQVSSIQTVEIVAKNELKNQKLLSHIKVEHIVAEKSVSQPEYGQHTDEIQKILSNTPLGAEIYLEQKESGEWYLKIEKTFTAQKDEEKTEITEPMYGETILI